MDYSAAALDDLCINTLGFLSVDAVQKPNSGHPGLPLGAAPMAYVLWTKFLKHNPTNPDWFDRDRFVLSAGHSSTLLYSLLHMTGYELSLEQIKQRRSSCWRKESRRASSRCLVGSCSTLSHRNIAMRC